MYLFLVYSNYGADPQTNFWKRKEEHQLFKDIIRILTNSISIEVTNRIVDQTEIFRSVKTIVLFFSFWKALFIYRISCRSLILFSCLTKSVTNQAPLNLSSQVTSPSGGESPRIVESLLGESGRNALPSSLHCCHLLFIPVLFSGIKTGCKFDS